MKKSSKFVKLPKTPNSELHGDLHVTSQVSPPKTPQKRQDMRVEEPEHDRTSEVTEEGKVEKSGNSKTWSLNPEIVLFELFLVASFGPVSWSRSRGATAIVGVEVVNAGIVHSRQCLIDSSSSKSQLYYYVVRVCFRSCDQLWPCKNLQNTMAQQSRRIDHI